MLNHKGTKELETTRLLLRKALPEDARPMYENWASDPQVTRFLTWPVHGSSEISERVIKSWMEEYEKDDFYQWMIELKALNQPIGTISVVSKDDGAEKAELGYCIGREWWHRGIMSEALPAVIDFLFEEVVMNRIEARHDTSNPHSSGVMAKCGMTFEGISPKSGRNNQGVCDIARYAILREEYRRNQSL